MEKYPNIKMIVTDLDSTLLKNNKTISPFTDSILARLQERRILFAIATARPIRAVKGALPFLKFDASIFHNGALIYAGNRLLAKFGIENPAAITSVLLKELPHSRISIEANDTMYSNCAPEEIWSGIEYTKTRDFHETAHLVADKILVEAHSLDDMNRFQAYIPDNSYLQLSENLVAMIMNRQATKANGIKILAAHYGISLEEIAVFGDDYNDIDILQSCGIGIAVDNALPEVKAAADQICGSNEQDGVARWIADNLL